MRLDKTCRENGRSLSNEAEMRIDRTFRDDDAGAACFEMAFDLAYGRALTGLLMLLGRAAQDAGAHAAFTADPAAKPEHWLSSPAGFDAAARAIHTILEQLRPKGSIPIDENRIGEGIANGHLHAIAVEPDDFTFDRVRSIKARLGPIADRLRGFDPAFMHVSAVAPMHDAPGILLTFTDESPSEEQ